MQTIPQRLEQSSSFIALKNLLSRGAISGGGAHPIAYGAMHAILELQATEGISGSAIEIGVLHGDTALLIASSLVQQEQMLIADISASLLQETMDLLVRNGVSASSVRAFVGSTDRPRFRSDLLSVTASTGLRFAHIDGEHSFSLALNDLHRVSEALSSNGIICVDDMNNISCACVTEAVYKFLEGGQFVPMLFVPNKVFLCNRRYFEFYREFGIAISDYLNESLNLTSALATSGHVASSGYLSLFPAQQRFFQVVGHTFPSASDFLAHRVRG